MMPEAWDVEHNHLHHYQLGEDADPDLVERNMKTTREGSMPMWLRYAQVASLSMIWKWFYYGFKHEGVVRKTSERRKREAKNRISRILPGEMPSTVLTTIQSALFAGNFGALFETIKCFTYATFQFGILPAIGYAIGGTQMAVATLATTVLADMFTNLHSFIVIATNHVGR